jgi:hypothetical protein
MPSLVETLAVANASSIRFTSAHDITVTNVNGSAISIEKMVRGAAAPDTLPEPLLADERLETTQARPSW